MKPGNTYILFNLALVSAAFWAAETPAKPSDAERAFQSIIAGNHEPPKPGPDGIKWASNGQKTTCETYLMQMRDLFLKTRNQSINGVSCDTAKHAGNFLRLAERCKRNCPEGLLEKKGYTNRIMRELSFLESRGPDLCKAVPPTNTTPVMN
jgi:hypothetical protein